MKHKRYILNWHTRTIEVYVASEYSHTIGFAAAERCQRDIVRLLLRSLDRNRFELVGHTSDKAWVYEGYAL